MLSLNGPNQTYRVLVVYASTATNSTLRAALSLSLCLPSMGVREMGSVVRSPREWLHFGRIINQYRRKTVYTYKQTGYKTFTLVPIVKILHFGGGQGSKLYFACPLVDRVPALLCFFFFNYSRVYNAVYIAGY